MRMGARISFSAGEAAETQEMIAGRRGLSCLKHATLLARYARLVAGRAEVRNMALMGLMQKKELLISGLLDHAVQVLQFLDWKREKEGTCMM
jgi:hypothetical protein